MNQDVVVVGAGQAGGVAVEELRKKGHRGRITLIGRESYPPYQRPPLSKDFLAGRVEIERLYLRPLSFYREQNIDLMLGHEVIGVDRDAQRVVLRNGCNVPYDTLLLATGSSARRLSIPGSASRKVFYVRELDDAVRLKESLCAGSRLAVIGAGFIGLEIAAVAATGRMKVTVIEAARQPLQRVVQAEVGDFFAKVHRAHGVELMLEEGVTGIDSTRGDEAVLHTSSGAVVCADAVVIGVGAVPNTELAHQAGLDVADGIRVDEHGRSSDSRIFAAGDATRHFNAHLGIHLRMEAWQSARNQGASVAANIAQDAKPFSEVPWFWSNQYDQNLQIAGIPHAGDDVVWSGAPDCGSFGAFHLREGTLAAAVLVNAPRAMRTVRHLIASRAPVAPRDVAKLLSEPA